MAEFAEQADMFSLKSETEIVLYLLTGQGNLVDILSSGQIKPASGYKKYYPDPGRYCQTAIPLFFHAPPENLIQEVVSKELTIYPVLIEVDLSEFTGRAMLIDGDLHIKATNLADRETGLVLLLPGVLPATSIRRVHFRNDEERREYSMRRYANLPEKQPEMAVSSGLFQGSTVDSTLLIERLGQAGEQFNTTDRIIAQKYDATGGMYMLVGRLAMDDLRFPLSALQTGLEMLRTLPDRENVLKLTTAFPDEYRFLSCLVSVLPEEAGGLSPAGIAESVPGVDDLALLAVALQYLASIEPAEFSTDMFLEALQNELAGGKLPIASGWIANFKSFTNLVDKIKTGDTPREDFPKYYPIRENPLPAAILTLIMRKEPEYILAAAKTHDSLNTIPVIGMALLLSGALYGRTLLASINHPPAPFIKWCDFLLCQIQNNLSGGPVGLMDQQAVKFIPSEKEKPEELMTGDETLLQRIPAKPEKAKGRSGKGTRGKSQKKKVPEEKNMSETASVSKPDDVVKRLLDASFSDSDDPDSVLALEICFQEGWADLVRSRVNLENREYTIEYRSGKKEFRLSGFGTMVAELVPGKVEELKKRLSTLDPKKLQQVFLEGRRE